MSFLFVIAACTGQLMVGTQFEVVDRDGTCYQTEGVTSYETASDAGAAWFSEYGDGTTMPYWAYGAALDSGKAGGLIAGRFYPGFEW